MIDRRNLILNELFNALKTIPAVAQVVRNRGEMPTGKRPAIVLLDGDEEADDGNQDRGRPSTLPNRVVMLPEIFVAMDNRKPHNEDIGEDLNALRVQIIKTVLGNASLKNLVGTNGEIRYRGIVTDLSYGQAMTGIFGVSFAFVYPLNLEELT